MTQEQYNLICVAIEHGLSAMSSELIRVLNNTIEMAQKYQEMTEKDATERKEVN